MKDVRTATLAFAHFLGLPKAVPAIVSEANRIAASRPVEAVARVAKASVQIRAARAVQTTAEQLCPVPAPHVSISPPKTTARQERIAERNRCKQIMNAAMKAGAPRIGLEMINTDMRAADAVSLIQLLNLDTASLCARWSKGQVIGANE